MGDVNRFDWAAMEAVAEHLESACSDLRLVCLNWPEPEEFSVDAATDLHVESARMWVGSVIDRLDVWAKRAAQAAAALERRETRRVP